MDMGDSGYSDAPFFIGFAVLCLINFVLIFWAARDLKDE